MFEMIIYIFFILAYQGSLQEFRSTCRQGVTWTVASSEQLLPICIFYFFITNTAGDSQE